MQQLKETDLLWHRDLPDVPDKSATQMKEFFDAPTRKLMQKINEIIGDAEQAGSLVGLEKRLIAETEALSARITEQDIKAIPFSGDGEYVGMAEDLPDGLLWFGWPENDGESGYDATVSCQIYVSAPEEPSVLTVEHGSFGFKSTDPEGNYALWIFHKKAQMTVSLVYRDSITRYGVITHVSAVTDTTLSLPNAPADAKAVGGKLSGINARLEAAEEKLANGAGDGGGSAEWKQLHSQNGEAVRYDDTNLLEVTGFSCTELRGMLNVKGGWDGVAEDMRYVYLHINDTSLRITSFCGEATYDAPDILFDISKISYAGARYLKIVLTSTPHPDATDDGYGLEPQTQQYIFLKSFTDEAITSIKIESLYTWNYDQYYRDYTAKLELEGR